MVRGTGDNKTADDRIKEKMIGWLWSMYRDYRRGLEKPPASKRSPVHKISVTPSTNEEGGPIEFRPMRDAIPQPAAGETAAPDTTQPTSQEQHALSS